MKSTICIAEDRQSCEPALRLLLSSLRQHCPAVEVNLFYPCADEGFVTWVKEHSQVVLQNHRLSAGSWNVKPEAIMHMMDRGFDEVIWIDSDIIVNRNLQHLFASVESDAVVTTEDALGDDRDDRNGVRARLWGFEVGRALPFGLNTGVLRVSRQHYCLMKRWRELLQASAYQEFQRKPWSERPIHMLGDQDVFTALLTSKEYSDLPIHILRRGKDILQFNGVYGYTVAERIRNVTCGGATFVHSFAGKPWSESWPPKSSLSLREYIKKLYLDLSPYTLSARQFKNMLGCEAEWMEAHYFPSRLLRVAGMNRPELPGLPIAAVMDILRAMKYAVRMFIGSPRSRTNADTAGRLRPVEAPQPGKTRRTGV